MNIEIKTEKYSNGIIKYEIPHLNGVVHGTSRYWYENGKIDFELPYKNGNWEGLYKQYNFHSTYSVLITCSKNKQHGIWLILNYGT